MTLCPFNRSGPVLGKYTFSCPECGIVRKVKSERLNRKCPVLSKGETSPERGLGDTVASALKLVGITPERVTRWLGRPCGCTERRERLNQLGRWARRIILGRIDKASAYLDEILENKK